MAVKKEPTDYVEQPVYPEVPAVEVYPINVGQGDSILVKLKYTKGMLHQIIIMMMPINKLTNMPCLL